MNRRRRKSPAACNPVCPRVVVAMMKPLITKNRSTPAAPKSSSVPPARTVSSPSRAVVRSTAWATTTPVAATNRKTWISSNLCPMPVGNIDARRTQPQIITRTRTACAISA